MYTTIVTPINFSAMGGSRTGNPPRWRAFPLCIIADEDVRAPESQAVFDVYFGSVQPLRGWGMFFRRSFPCVSRTAMNIQPLCGWGQAVFKIGNIVTPTLFFGNGR